MLLKRLTLLCLVTSFWITAQVFAATETVGGYTYTYTVTGGVATIGTGTSTAAITPTPTGALTIPSTLGGYPVRNVGDYSFYYCSGLTSVTFPANVTNIGIAAFYGCSGLTSVIIPSSVTTIARVSFAGCSGLTSLTIPSSVTSIEDQAFYYCTGLMSVTIPSSVTNIGYYAFAYTDLSSVTIPDGVTFIDEGSFYCCLGLTSVTISSSVASIGNQAFADCRGLVTIVVDAANPNYSSAGGVLFNKSKSTLVQCPGGTVGAYTIPSSVNNIGYGAFFNCIGLLSVTIPFSVTSIGNNAFYGCSDLTSMTIPDGVTCISAGTFCGCSGLTSVTIPSSVTNIGYYAFSECRGLTSVTIPSSVTSISEYAFGSCSGLTSLTLPSGLTSIGAEAFQFCAGLISVVIPSSVTSIGKNAFSICRSLTMLTVDTANPNYYSENGVLFDKSKAILIQYPVGKLGAYTIPSSVTSIGARAFYAYTGPSLTLPSGLASIGESAFGSCTGLTSVTIPSSVTGIANFAFSGCTGLSYAIFLGNAPTMGSVVFNSTAPGFTVYFSAGSTGFTTPIWMGYPSSSASPLIIGTVSPLAGGMVGAAYSQTLSAVGGIQPYTWSISVGSLPAGLSLSSAGVISGTPTATVTASFTVRVTGNDGIFTTKVFSLTIAAPAPEIAVEQPAGTGLADGSASIGFGSVNLGSSSSAITFTVKNLGSANLTGLAVTKDGANATDFSVGGLGAATLAAGASTTFTVTFTPGAAGSRVAAIHIASNDADENPFDISLTGTGVNIQKTLTVVSAQGGAQPGTLTADWGSALVQSVTNSPVLNGATQYVCTAATVAGNAFTQVGATNVTLTLTNSATLTWQWQTQYLLTTGTDGSGTVTASGWYNSESNATVTATAAANWHFVGFSGDTNGCGIAGSTLAVPMTRARAIVATFAANPSATVSNVVAAQVPGTKQVLITYDVASDQTNLVTVSVVVSNAAGVVSASHFAGDVGPGVPVGAGRQIVWDGGADQDGQNLTGLKVWVDASAGAGGTPPPGMVAIPAGTNNGTDPDFGAYSLAVAAFFMDATEVTNDEMVRVMQWAYEQGMLSVTTASVHNAQDNQQELLDLDSTYCRITWDGSVFGMMSARGSGYPCVEVTWYGAAAYCNYRSQMEGRTACYNLSDWSCNFAANGYRLPTNTEWEYAARGGLSGKRFPWGDTIQHSRATYYSMSSYSYDTSPTRGCHPTYLTGASPVGAFAANGYVLYDMAGNVEEWCNDASGSNRCIRGGCLEFPAWYARCGNLEWADPGGRSSNAGFRAVCR